MAGSFSRALLIIFIGYSNPSLSGPQIIDMTCAHYLGLSKTGEIYDGLITETGNQSKAYQAGHELGVAVRQYTMANWVHGYLVGYVAGASEDSEKTVDINTLKARIRVYCNTHENKTMQEVAETFR